MKKVKTSVSLNLSNQANNYNSKKSDLFQMNCFIILGLGYLESKTTPEEIVSVSIKINKAGEITIDGLDEEMVNDQNINIYSDKRVTTSEDS